MSADSASASAGAIDMSMDLSSPSPSPSLTPHPASAMDAELEDELVAEYPIYLNQDLSHSLYLLQSPLRPVHRSYSHDVGELHAMRVKPIQKKVEIEYRLESNTLEGRLNYDEDHEWNVKTFKYVGKSIPPKTNYCVGVIREGQLHLTPLHAICRLKPSFDFIDIRHATEIAENERSRAAYAAQQRADLSDSEAEEEKGPELKPLIMKVKKKETERAQTIKRQSHAFIKSMEEKEEWIKMHVHTQTSTPSIEHFDRFFSSIQTPVHFNIPASQYLSYVNPSEEFESNVPFNQQVFALLSSARVVRFGELIIKLKVQTSSHMNELLILLDRICWNVQGCWCLKSSILYDPQKLLFDATLPPPTSSGAARANTLALSSDRLELSRDYIITQFAKYRIIKRVDIQRIVKTDTETLQTLLSELSYRTDDGWVYKLDTDTEFITQFADIAISHTKQLADLSSRLTKLLCVTTHSRPSLHGAPGVVPYQSADSIQDQLTQFVSRHFLQFGVVAKQFVLDQLHQYQKQKEGQPLLNITPQQFDETFLSMSRNIKGDLYVRSSLNNPNVDKYRVLLCELFSTSSTLRKPDLSLKISEVYPDEGDIQENMYRKIMKEFAIFSKGGHWELKNGYYTTGTGTNQTNNL